MAPADLETAGGRLPDFLVVGAARSGTTTIHRWLVEHPQVYVPRDKRPEPHFFLKSGFYRQGLGAYSQRFFADPGDDARALGEISTSYLYGAQVPGRIARDLPDVRLVMLLRHPVHRAWSSYWHTRRAGFEPLDFARAVAAEPQRLAHPVSPFWDEIRPHAYLDRSRYDAQLARYRAVFPPEQIFVALFDELEASPARLARRLFEFLGVDPDVRPAGLNARLNRSAPPVSRMDPALYRQLSQRLAPATRRLAADLKLDLSRWLEPDPPPPSEDA